MKKKKTQPQPLNLPELKEFLRIDGNDEDDYLNILILLSPEICKNHLRLGDDVELPKNNSIKQAQLLACGYFFENRTGTKDGMPEAVYHLLAPYREAKF